MAIINLGEERKVNNKLIGEKETRANYLAYAKMLGCEKEFVQIRDKFDGLLRNCTNEQERKDIGKLGVVEINKLFAFYKQLYVDGNIIEIK
jgi:5'-deoxynucleotidase YfbR-like HD superfamily hydrolase